MRLALGVSYRGGAYHGWQSQPDGRTVQDQVERALGAFAGQPVRCICAGRTDTGVHGLNQVIHFDTELARDDNSWVRGTNRYLPSDIAIQWCRQVPDHFHSRFAATGRRYAYLLLESPVRPGIEQGAAGWTFRPLAQATMEAAAALLIGEHDFSAFRAAGCQSITPVKHLREVGVRRVGSYWRFDFEANAFLHHMIRNIMGGLIAVGNGTRPVAWMADVLASRDRRIAAPTFAPDGLYFVGPYYDPAFEIPRHVPPMDWLPGGAPGLAT
jgi:tRNA pseudouridine38-40 synthase